MNETFSVKRGLRRYLRRGATMLILAAALAACGSAEDTPLVAVGRSVVGPLFGGNDDAAAGPQTPQQVRARLTADVIDQIGQPFMVVSSVRNNEATLFTSVSSANGNTSWRDVTNNEVTLTQTGVMRSTRGLGFDLMSNDVGQTVHALMRGQSGTVQRTHIYVDGGWQSTPISITCQLSVGSSTSMVIGARTQSVRPVTELCRYDTETFENRYWVNRNGQAIRSVQWVGPEVGLLEFELFVP